MTQHIGTDRLNDQFNISLPDWQQVLENVPSPIFYLVSALPAKYRLLLFMNPLTPAIEEAHGVLFFGKSPDLSMLIVYRLVSASIAWRGFAWFQKTRKGIADVL